MRWVDGHRRQQRIDLGLVEDESIGARVLVQVFPVQNADLLGGQRWAQHMVPAGVLRVDKLVQHYAELFQPLLERQSALVRALWLVEAVLDALQQAGHADLHELVQIVGRNGKKLHPLQQRIGGVLGLFQNTLVEEHPALVAVEEALLRRGRGSLLRGGFC